MRTGQQIIPRTKNKINIWSRRKHSQLQSKLKQTTLKHLSAATRLQLLTSLRTWLRRRQHWGDAVKAMSSAPHRFHRYQYIE